MFANKFASGSKGYVFCRNRYRFDSYVAGLDIGSGLSKAVILQDGRLHSSAVRPTEGDFILAADRVLSGALEKARLTQSDIEYIGACGLGTRFIPYQFSKSTDIVCQGLGTYYFLHEVRSVIEIGNQNTRVFKLSYP